MATTSVAPITIGDLFLLSDATMAAPGQMPSVSSDGGNLTICAASEDGIRLNQYSGGYVAFYDGLGDEVGRVNANGDATFQRNLTLGGAAQISLGLTAGNTIINGYMAVNGPVVSYANSGGGAGLTENGILLTTGIAHHEEADFINAKSAGQGGFNWYITIPNTLIDSTTPPLMSLGSSGLSISGQILAGDARFSNLTASGNITAATLTVNEINSNTLASGILTLAHYPAQPLEAANKKYVDDAIAESGNFVYPGAGVTVSTGTAWGTPIDPATLAFINKANTFTAAQTIQGNLTIQGTLTGGGLRALLGASETPDNINTVIRTAPGGTGAAINPPSLESALYLCMDAGNGTNFGDGHSNVVAFVDRSGNISSNGNLTASGNISANGNLTINQNATINGRFIGGGLETWISNTGGGSTVNTTIRTAVGGTGTAINPPNGIADSALYFCMDTGVGTNFGDGAGHVMVSFDKFGNVIAKGNSQAANFTASEGGGAFSIRGQANPSVANPGGGIGFNFYPGAYETDFLNVHANGSSGGFAWFGTTPGVVPTGNLMFLDGATGDLFVTGTLNSAQGLPFTTGLQDLNTLTAPGSYYLADGASNVPTDIPDSRFSFLENLGAKGTGNLMQRLWSPAQEGKFYTRHWLGGAPHAWHSYNASTI